jgi:hypothetical protein
MQRDNVRPVPDLAQRLPLPHTPAPVDNGQQWPVFGWTGTRGGGQRLFLRENRVGPRQGDVLPPGRRELVEPAHLWLEPGRGAVQGDGDMSDDIRTARRVAHLCRHFANVALTTTVHWPATLRTVRHVIGWPDNDGVVPPGRPLACGRIIIHAARAGQPPAKRFQPTVEPFAHNNGPTARHSFDVLPVPPVAAMVSRGC